MAYAITAYSMCNALGLSTAEVVAALAEGRSGLTKPLFELPFETYCGAIRSEDLPAPPPHISLRYDSHLLRMLLLPYAEVVMPVREAILRWGDDRVALILSTSTGGLLESEAAFRQYKREGTFPSFFDFELQHPFHVIADVLAELTGIRGPRYVISTACSSGGKAIATARRLLEVGVVDAVLTGAVDSLCQSTLRGFCSLGILSPEPCRPFSRNRDGLSLGEGAGVLLLERSGGNDVFLLGVGESSDAYRIAAPDPDGRGARAAMSAALIQAGLTPGDIDYINSHGTGTKSNDQVEAGAIFEMFGGAVPVVSTKGYTGHLLGAGGMIETIFSLVALEQGWIPASKGAEPLDETLQININTHRQIHLCRAVLSNSFGFGGSNISVLVGAAS